MCGWTSIDPSAALLCRMLTGQLVLLIPGISTLDLLRGEIHISGKLQSTVLKKQRLSLKTMIWTLLLNL